MRTKIIIAGLLITTVVGAGLLFFKARAGGNANPARHADSRGADPFIQDHLKQGKKSNRLIHEKSPYLLRHAFDPVDWNPWGEEAFEKARKANKPIFLSIGYASCFACYSMQRDVFENREIANQMNRDEVNILVDREERPDIDRLYLSVVQTISGTGGWPMSLFLTPDRKPFFGSTNISATVFREVLSRVHEIWQKEPQKLSESGSFIASYMEEVTKGQKNNARAGAGSLRKGFDAFHELYDQHFGGFGSAPKFPHPMILNFLLRYYERTGEKSALEMTLKTLQKMEAGAIFDHVGYGFHRYSADDEWRTPHFEKMLYDQALLTIAYLEAFQITHNPVYAETARNILTYVQREMLSPEGAFYGAQDAASPRDSSSVDEKVPGVYYTWTSAEVDQILGPSDAPIFRYVSGIRPEGNSLRDPLSLLANKNVIFLAHTEEEAALKFRKELRDIDSTVKTDLQKLLDARERRPKPQVDDKIILSWNALMISALAKASEVLGENSYLKSAERCNYFLEQKLYMPSTHRLLRRYRNGDARYEGTLQDYAFCIQALLDLYEASFNIRYLKMAIVETDQMLELFEDKAKGGFFDAAVSDHSLPFTTKETYDDSEPSGNSIAILDLLRLSQITGKRRYRIAADRSLQFFSRAMMDQPETTPQLLIALQFSLHKPKQIVIAGPPNDALTKRLLAEIHARFLPDLIILLADGDEGQKTLSSFFPFLSDVRMIHDRSTAYVCENDACKLPTSDPARLARILEGEGSP